MTTSEIGILIAIIGYMIGMICIGFYYTKKSRTTHDFYLGGRKLGPFVTAMSAEASDMSSWLLMGLPGVAYFTGVADAFWTAAGLAIGTYVNWLIVAKRIRHYSYVSRNSITLPDFFANRYRDNSNILKFISATIIIIFFVPYTASGFAACGKLFNRLFGIDYMTAMIFSAIVIVAYTSLGGFLAASTTDLIQSIIMSIALAIVLFYGVNSVGGMDVVYSNVKGAPYKKDDDIKELLRQQIMSPVLFENSIRDLINKGVDTFIEVGPGKALSGFVKKIDKSVKIYNVCDIDSLESTISSLEL